MWYKDLYKHQCKMVSITISYNPRILNQQGVVTCMSPVEAFATVIKIFERQKVCLIIPSKALGSLIFMGQRSNWSWFFDFHSSKVTLISWSALKKGLITWFNFDPGHKCFYTGHIRYKHCTHLVPTHTHSEDRLVYLTVLRWDCCWSYIERKWEWNCGWRKVRED